MSTFQNILSLTQDSLAGLKQLGTFLGGFGLSFLLWLSHSWLSNFCDYYVVCVVCLGHMCYTSFMKLYFDKRLKDPTYYIQKGYRNGSKVTCKNVKIIGKHSELLKITDDPLSYAKEQVRLMNEKEKSGLQSIDLHLDFNELIQNNTEKSIAPLSTRNVGYFYLQHIYRQLSINEFFKNACSGNKITFDIDRVNRFLVYDRILRPGSKLHTWQNKDWYYEEPDFEYQHIMRTMDILEDNYAEYISWLFKYSNNIVKRDTSRCYYDCTNYYCETETNDDNYVDEVTGEEIKGLREYGKSKENRPNPIVEMGLFMDNQGIPMSMCIHPGNTNEQVTAIPLEKELIKMFKDADHDNNGSFIYVADGGLGSTWIRQFNSMGGRCFIVTQSIKKMSEVMQNSVFNDCDYWIPTSDNDDKKDKDGRTIVQSDPISIEFLKTFDKNDKDNLRYYNSMAYKVIDADNLIDLGLTETKICKNGKAKSVKVKGTLKQKIIIRFSRKYMEYQRYIRNRQVERAKNLIRKCDPDELKKSQNDAKRFIKKTTTAKDGGEVQVSYSIDTDRIAEEEKYDGFYALATNLQIDMISAPDNPLKSKPDLTDVLEIVSISETRNKIEECFRIMKTNFEARPIYHRKHEHIISHFMICYTALLIYRLLEIKVNQSRYHCTTQDIIETLNHMIVGNVEDQYYISLYGGCTTLTALEETFNGGLNHKRYYPKTLNKLSRSF